MTELGVCPRRCVITGQVDFSHPAWGRASLLTTLSASPDSFAADIVVFDEAGVIQWRYDGDSWYELAPARPAIDTTGHIFLNYNPGRYNGVIVLEAAPDTFRTFGTLPAPGEYDSRFYGATTVDVDSDGVFEIDQESNDCTPSCAGGTVSHQIYKWNGGNYVAE